MVCNINSIITQSNQCLEIDDYEFIFSVTSEFAYKNSIPFCFLSSDFILSKIQIVGERIQGKRRCGCL